MTALVYNQAARLATGKYDDILGPALEDVIPAWEGGELEEATPDEGLPWWVYLAPVLGPVGLLAPTVIAGAKLLPEDSAIREVVAEAGDIVSEGASELWTAATSGLSVIWSSLKWVLLAILIIVVLVAFVVLR